MKWATWENVGVDRMGCAWLIRRFIDVQAEFLFIPVAQTTLPEACEPFDIPGVRLTHRHGHCTFHTIVGEYGLDDAVLRRIASIIDEADVVQPVAVERSAAGLDLICRGIRRISADDHGAIARGQLVYDALYAQLQAEHMPSFRMTRE
jgi:hypothetical protein